MLELSGRAKERMQSIAVNEEGLLMGQSKAERERTKPEVPCKTSGLEMKKEPTVVQFSRHLRKPRKRNGAGFDQLRQFRIILVRRVRRQDSRQSV